jgi:hypothetical protein
MATGAATVMGQERVMNVARGPDAVFDRPVDQLMAELAGATATDENGRVGNELVFWGFELADGRDVYFYACAKREDVDCAGRAEAICIGRTEVLRRIETAGQVRHMRCREIATVGVGDLRPGCTDREEDDSLHAGLVQCH